MPSRTTRDLENMLMAAQLGREIVNPIAQGMIRNRQREQDLSDYQRQMELKEAMAGLQPTSDMGALAGEVNVAQKLKRQQDLEDFQKEMEMRQKYATGKDRYVQDQQTGQWYDLSGGAAKPVSFAGAAPSQSPALNEEAGFPPETFRAPSFPSLSLGSKPPDLSSSPVSESTGAFSTSLKPVPERAIRAFSTPTKSPQSGKIANDPAWNFVVNKADPYQASSRSVFGTVANADRRANTAMSLLTKPGPLTTTEAGQLQADLAAMVSGMSPTDYGMKEQEYDTLTKSIAKVGTYFTGKPTDALPPDLKQEMIKMVNRFKDVNKADFKQHLDYLEKGYSGAISRHPDDWKAMRNIIGGGIASGEGNAPSSAQSHPEADQALEWARANPNDPRSKKILQRLGQ